ncbi:hypothetical protein [Paenibacillus thermotolerans]|uniref:hypothetical protein n=1 Tax=Paenibacillus thermotolerans TaxID=3027807 RepID=UPI002368E0DB|nr:MULTISPECIES: hypothetical protein [unclassified Paenibacillus]
MAKRNNRAANVTAGANGAAQNQQQQQYNAEFAEEAVANRNARKAGQAGAQQGMNKQ